MNIPQYSLLVVENQAKGLITRKLIYDSSFKSVKQANRGYIRRPWRVDGYR